MKYKAAVLLIVLILHNISTLPEWSGENELVTQERTSVSNVNIQFKRQFNNQKQTLTRKNKENNFRAKRINDLVINNNPLSKYDYQKRNKQKSTTKIQNLKENHDTYVVPVLLSENNINLRSETKPERSAKFCRIYTYPNPDWYHNSPNPQTNQPYYQNHHNPPITKIIKDLPQRSDDNLISNHLPNNVVETQFSLDPNITSTNLPQNPFTTDKFGPEKNDIELGSYKEQIQSAEFENSSINAQEESSTALGTPMPDQQESLEYPYNPVPVEHFDSYDDFSNYNETFDRNYSNNHTSELPVYDIQHSVFNIYSGENIFDNNLSELPIYSNENIFNNNLNEPPIHSNKNIFYENDSDGENESGLGRPVFGSQKHYKNSKINYQPKIPDNSHYEQDRQQLSINQNQQLMNKYRPSKQYPAPPNQMPRYVSPPFDPYNRPLYNHKPMSPPNYNQNQYFYPPPTQQTNRNPNYPNNKFYYPPFVSYNKHPKRLKPTAQPPTYPQFKPTIWPTVAPAPDFSKSPNVDTEFDECGFSTSWTMNCYECSCKESSAKCIRDLKCKIPDDIDSEPKLCKPYTSFPLDGTDCHRCECNADGFPVCTFDYYACLRRTGEKFYNRKERKNESSKKKRREKNDPAYYELLRNLPLSTSQNSCPKYVVDFNVWKCQPNSKWTARCFSCICNDEGQPVCSKIGNCKPAPSHVPPKCKPGTSLSNEGCQNCWCDDDGFPAGDLPPPKLQGLGKVKGKKALAAPLSDALNEVFSSFLTSPLDDADASSSPTAPLDETDEHSPLTASFESLSYNQFSWG